MSEFPIVTNKYCAKAEFSANICNDVYKFDFIGVDTEAELIDVTADGEADKTVLDFESPVVLTNEYGNAISIVGTDEDTVIIEGNDYLGQPIVAEVSVTTTEATLSYQFKYIRKITFTKGTITIKEVNDLAFPPFKTVNILSATKNGANIEVPTLTGPNLSKNVDGLLASRGSIELSNVSKDDKLTFICVADNSTVVIDGEEVGGLYGNPSVPASEDDQNNQDDDDNEEDNQDDQNDNVDDNDLVDDNNDNENGVG